MYEQDKDAADERWYGVQEAARLLGMHRATLFRALRSGQIIADRTTPMGRARFREETLLAYREFLRHQAAASLDHVYLPVRIMARLANVLAAASLTDDPDTILQETLRLLCPPHGNFDMVCVGIHAPDATDPYALEFPAEYGFPDRLKAAYRYLRPYEDFPINTVMRTGSPDICNDIRHHPFPNATAMRTLLQNNVNSYAVFPIITGAGASKRTIGVLAVCGHTAHRFSTQERLFLGGVSDALSACFVQGLLRTRLSPLETPAMLSAERTLDIASRLLDTALSATRCPDVFPPSALPIEALCNLFVEESQALAAWVQGFPPRACGNTLDAPHGDAVLSRYRCNLQSLVRRARTDGGLKRELWQNQMTAVALPVPLSCGGRGAVGAVWQGVRAEVAAEEILLSTLASACSLVSQSQ